MSAQYPPFGRPAASTIAWASAAVAMFVYGSHSMPTSKPCAAARSQSRPNASAASSTVPSYGPIACR